MLTSYFLIAKTPASENVKLADSFRAAFAVYKSPKPRSPSGDGSGVKLQGNTSQVDQDKTSIESSGVKADSKTTASIHLKPAFHTEGVSIEQKANTKTQDELAQPYLPLSMQNVMRKVEAVQEHEEERLLSKVKQPYLLSAWEVQGMVFQERMRSWLDSAKQDCAQDVPPQVAQDAESVHTGGLEIRSSQKLASQEDDDRSDFNPYLAERSSRAQAAAERISGLQWKDRGSGGIKPGVSLSLRHAKYSDAMGLAGIYNSYVRATVQCLDTEPITVDIVYQRIDESRKQELPFIVAINEDHEKMRIKILGYARLTNFLDGQLSVSGTARLEIMVWHQTRGYNVGRCLMDAMMTFVDPKYSPKGGYYFNPKELENCGSLSCRPLTNVVIYMSHSDSEVSRYRRIRKWLSKEHQFFERGNLPSVAHKMAQS